jgi:hypothetical protein
MLDFMYPKLYPDSYRETDPFVEFRIIFNHSRLLSSGFSRIRFTNFLLVNFLKPLTHSDNFPSFCWTTK